MIKLKQLIKEEEHICSDTTYMLLVKCINNLYDMHKQKFQFLKSQGFILDFNIDKPYIPKINRMAYEKL